MNTTLLNVDEFVNLNRFNAAWENVTEEIPFDRDWSDGQGEYTHAAESVDFWYLNVGSSVKSLSSGKRRIIGIRATHGPVVVYERYMPGDKRGVQFHFAANEEVIAALTEAAPTIVLENPLTPRALDFLLSTIASI